MVWVLGFEFEADKSDFVRRLAWGHIVPYGMVKNIMFSYRSLHSWSSSTNKKRNCQKTPGAANNIWRSDLIWKWWDFLVNEVGLRCTHFLIYCAIRNKILRSRSQRFMLHASMFNNFIILITGLDLIGCLRNLVIKKNVLPVFVSVIHFLSRFDYTFCS